MATFGEGIESAIKTKDVAKLAELVHQLRARGATYDDIYKMARNRTGIGLPEFDALMEEIDERDSQ